MFSFSLVSSCALALLAVAGVRAESHTITFTNRCGFGTPTLVSHGAVLSTGGAFTINGPINATAFLQTGSCGSNGENCCDLNVSLSASASVCNTPSCVGVSGAPLHCLVSGGNVEITFCSRLDACLSAVTHYMSLAQLALFAYTDTQQKCPSMTHHTRAASNSDTLT
ncbi:unnamed protein product [Peniophora sp. CBMAI 1063]|nr:unnamed protein product [Peniophora sp. CBMAI 1063]